MEHGEAREMTLKNRMPGSMKLSVPWNHDLGFLERLEPMAPHMANIYMPFHPGICGTSRVWRGPEEEAAYREEVDRVAAWTADRGLGLVLVANILGRAVQRSALVEEVRRVAGRAGKLRLTFTDAVTAARIRSRLPDRVDVGASVLANVASAIQALYWQEAAGASFITVAREVNRRPGVLEDIRSLGLRTGLVTCDECIPFCPFYTHHLGRGDERGFVVATCSPETACILASRPWLIAQKEVLPGHLRHLDGLVDEVKIPGREQPTDRLIELMTAYLCARSLVHPTGYYEEPPDLWDVISTCDLRCHDCTTCAEMIHPLMDEAQMCAIKLGRQSEEAQSAEGEPLPGAGTLDAPWRFVNAEGRVVEIWLEPAGGRRPLRQVGGLAVFYRCPGKEVPGVAELIHAVGDILEASRHGTPAAPARLVAPTAGWPGGLTLDEPS